MNKMTMATLILTLAFHAARAETPAKSGAPEPFQPGVRRDNGKCDILIDGNFDKFISSTEEERHLQDVAATLCLPSEQSLREMITVKEMPSQRAKVVQDLRQAGTAAGRGTITAFSCAYQMVVRSNPQCIDEKTLAAVLWLKDSGKTISDHLIAQVEVDKARLAFLKSLGERVKSWTDEQIGKAVIFAVSERAGSHALGNHPELSVEELNGALARLTKPEAKPNHYVPTGKLSDAEQPGVEAKLEKMVGGSDSTVMSAP